MVTDTGEPLRARRTLLLQGELPRRALLRSLEAVGHQRREVVAGLGLVELGDRGMGRRVPRFEKRAAVLVGGGTHVVAAGPAGLVDDRPCQCQPGAVAAAGWPPPRRRPCS